MLVNTRVISMKPWTWMGGAGGWGPVGGGGAGGCGPVGGGAGGRGPTADGVNTGNRVLPSPSPLPDFLSMV